MKLQIAMPYKLYLYHYKNTLLVNVAVSFLFSALSPLDLSFHPMPMLISFSIVFTTIGYGLTALAFLYFGKRTRYLYFNMRISFAKLYGFGFIANVMLVLTLNLFATILWL